MSTGSALPEDVASAAGRALGLAPGPDPFVHVQPLGGGCIHPAVRVGTAQGSAYFLKWSGETGPAGFAVEAEGLKSLSAAGGPRIPDVVAVDDGSDSSRGWLLLEFVEEGARHADTGVRLGERLARLHLASVDQTPGWERDGFIGPLPQYNAAAGRSWPRFWIEQRLVRQWERAKARMDAGTEEEWDALLPRIEEELTGCQEDRMSLLHGDLWSGNVLTDRSGDPVLIDPAVYRGHREVDLAMMELFGGFAADTFARYGEVSPLTPGYEELRRDIYQLYPLLVHVNLFGGGYVGSVRERIRRLMNRLR